MRSRLALTLAILGLVLVHSGARAWATDCADAVQQVLARYPQARPFAHPRQATATRTAWRWNDFVQTGMSGDAGELTPFSQTALGQAATRARGTAHARYVVLDTGEVRTLSDGLATKLAREFRMTISHEHLAGDRKIIGEGWIDFDTRGVVTQIQDDVVTARNLSQGRFPAGARSYPTLYEILAAQGYPMELRNTHSAIRP